MAGRYVTTMGFGGDEFQFEVHFLNSSNGVNDSKQFTDIIMNEFLEYVAKRVEVFGYEKAVIFERSFDGQLSEVKVIRMQKAVGVE